MRTTATIANVALLAYSAYALYEYGVPSNVEDLLLVFLIIATPSVSLIALQFKSDGGEPSTLELARQALRAKLRRAAKD